MPNLLRFHSLTSLDIVVHVLSPCRVEFEKLSLWVFVASFSIGSFH
jgi:hypothetical protein